MVTRGEKSAPNQDPRNALGKATVVIVAEYKVPDSGLADRGLGLHTATIRCTPAHMFDMRLTSHSRLNLITALLEAIDAGADEALMLDPLGAAPALLVQPLDEREARGEGVVVEAVAVLGHHRREDGEVADALDQVGPPGSS